MKTLPSEQTTLQLQALRLLVECGNLTLREPCNCGSQIRHNNGGNYHEIVAFRMDAGSIFRAESFTGDYGPEYDWQEVGFGAAIEEIATRIADGCHSE